MFLKIFAYLGENFVENYYNVRYRHSTTKNTASYLQLYQGKRELCNTVEPLKTDITRDRPKCASQRGVRLVEVLKSFDIRQNVLNVQLIVVGQALINTKMVYQSKVKILQSVAYYEIIIL